MARFFNIAGPCNPADHYMIDAGERLRQVIPLIEQKQYFVIHAARQSGKTTLLLDLTGQLNAEGRYYALYCSLEAVQGITDAGEGIPAVVMCIRSALRFSGIPGAAEFAATADYKDVANVLKNELTTFCASLDKPLVVFFDEADCLSESTLISFLRQLRNGYNTRIQAPFVHSLALAGMRNIRDYKAMIRSERETLGSASPFNIVTEALTLQNFTEEEVRQLYAQHTADTGQVFEDAAVWLAFEKTQGQPWLVNAIAREVVVKLLESDYSRPVTAVLVEQAIHNIIIRRDTHIDSLLERLKEPRVQRIIEPIILGESGEIDKLSDDYQYVRDLGLIRDTEDTLGLANPIYAEVVIRTLSYNTQDSLQKGENPYKMPRYLRDGKVDVTLLLQDFQVFWRENGAIWEARYDYKEAAPHLILMAFLQRVVNGGGRITREMAVERKRLDLCVEYQGYKYPIELKLNRKPGTLEEGLAQLSGYMDTLGCTEGWLVLFDQRPEVDWESKLYVRTKNAGNKTITVVGC